ncbi:hypothetical protein Hypma_001979 [Hypsizygus marmoreus]|uniref:Uncharacterized protein n=1 Tax=Hypsizygus marmoreus TaxID=39966 RepID=A0A369J5D0_HYPMA|nr:hypothetical protein Hypma_001979 [Hypsizygus marmoreus]
MTRSQLSLYSREAGKKVFRAKAKEQGIPFPVAAEARTNQLPDQKIYPNTHKPRRNQGRMDGTFFNGTPIESEYSTASWGCSGCDYCNPAEGSYEIACADGAVHGPTGTVLKSLLDIAKPAKTKGVAKEYEVVEPPQRVIVFDDEFDYTYESSVEDDFDWDDGLSEWDEVEGEKAESKASYSEIVKRKDREEDGGGEGP